MNCSFGLFCSLLTRSLFLLQTEMFGLNETARRRLILDDILQGLKSQVLTYQAFITTYGLVSLESNVVLNRMEHIRILSKRSNRV